MYLADMFDQLEELAVEYKSTSAPHIRTKIYDAALSVAEAVGLNRHELCAKLGRPYDELAEELDAREKLGNLTPELASQMYRQYEAKAKEARKKVQTVDPERQEIINRLKARGKKYSRPAGVL